MRKLAVVLLLPLMATPALARGKAHQAPARDTAASECLRPDSALAQAAMTTDMDAEESPGWGTVLSTRAQGCAQYLATDSLYKVAPSGRT